MFVLDDLAQLDHPFHYWMSTPSALKQRGLDFWATESHGGAGAVLNDSPATLEIMAAPHLGLGC